MRKHVWMMLLKECLEMIINVANSSDDNPKSSIRENLRSPAIMSVSTSGGCSKKKWRRIVRTEESSVVTGLSAIRVCWTSAPPSRICCRHPTADESGGCREHEAIGNRIRFFSIHHQKMDVV